MIIAIDFDETIAETSKWDWLHLDATEVPNAIKSILKLQQSGIKIILWSNRSGLTLWFAKQWCKKRGLSFWAINKLWWQKFIPWSPKIYADLFIDDRAIGCPLMLGRSKKIVNWSVINLLLEINNQKE